MPEQLSSVAIHDWWIADFTRPRLTTVRLPQFQLGQQSMRLLHLRMSGEPAMDLTVTDPPPQLIQRESTAPPPRRLLRARPDHDA